MTQKKVQKNVACLWENIFHWSIHIFLGFLPWSTLVSVFLLYKLGIPGGNFLKEGLLLIMIVAVVVLWFQQKKTMKQRFQFDMITLLILLYFVVMSVITIFTTGMRGLVFGGRYNFVFLIVFLVLYHGSQFLKQTPWQYLRTFLVSAGIMLLLSGFLKFPLQEEFLLIFGYSPSISAWDFGGAPPIFHGIEGGNVRRFQGILDGPNTMGAFLLLFGGIGVYFFHKKPEWYFVVGIVVLLLISMLFSTHSRSAMIALFGGVVIALAGGVGFLWKHYKTQMMVLFLMAISFGWIITVKYAGTAQALIGREGSTKGHAERMLVGLERFKEYPMGQGMGSSGPAYRHVLQLQDNGRIHVEEQDRYYIPESWYIQQFVEGGILGGILFLTISAVLFFASFRVHSILAGTFGAIGIMNLFLHTYESSVVSFLLFAILGIVLGWKKYHKTSVI